MKKILLFLFVFMNSFSFAKSFQARQIQIFHSYDDLYIRYIVPTYCDENLKYGPIIINDSLTISTICNMLNESIQCSNTLSPNVRFKVEFFINEEIKTLCFGQSGTGMIFSNISYKYNSQLCTYIIKIIESSGAKRPKKLLPPKK